MTLKSGERIQPPTSLAGAAMTVGEVVIVAGFSDGVPVLTSVPISDLDSLQPPSGVPSETGVVQWDVKITDTDIALAAPPTTVVVGSVFLIDSEYMTVTDVSNIDNPVVTRGSYFTTIATHAAGTEVKMWVS